MKRLLLFASLAATATYANVIYYGTQGSVFNCSDGNIQGCGTSTIVLGGTIQLTYVPTSTYVTVDTDTPTTNANFGYLQSACVANTDCSWQGLPRGIFLSLLVNQAQPETASGAIPGGALIGAGLSGLSSGSIITWGPTGYVIFTGSIAEVTYSLANTTFGIVPPASCDSNGENCGQTTIQGVITDPPINAPAGVPEPAVSMLLASGLLLIGAARRKKK